MLTRAIAYKYGLANGTRGKLVGVVYPAGAPVGSFPEALVVEVPEYCGPAFYPSEPKWVPILPKVSIKESNAPDSRTVSGCRWLCADREQGAGPHAQGGRRHQSDEWEEI